MPGDRVAARCAGWSVAMLLVMLALPLNAAEPKFPRLTGRVVDDAAILSPSTISRLTTMLARHEQTTGQQVVVVTLPSLQGFTIEEFGYQLGRYWGIGQKDKNTGALLIVAPREHKVRIEVGYGLEGELTDAQSSVIIQRDILPEFRRGDFDAGVLAGARSVLTALGGHPGTETAGTPPAVASNTGSVWPIVLFFVVWLIVALAINRMNRRAHLIRRIGRSGYDSGGFFGGFGGGSSDGGGGGFSGGGGSFGGGGASGSW
jgi:uncharacterized protein